MGAGKRPGKSSLILEAETPLPDHKKGTIFKNHRLCPYGAAKNSMHA
jgi:hypothetical protein